MHAPDFWSRKGLLPLLLSPLAAAYSLGGALRMHLTQPYRAPIPVVCIGNLVVGGAGKTPVALAVIARLKAAGLQVHALTRGYGGREVGPTSVSLARHNSADVGDEALLLAQQTTTWVSRDRPAGARAAAEAGAQIIVMDDGFQNPTLHKDLSLLVIDGGFGFGNGSILPAGPLREPAARGLARAQGVVLLGEPSQEFITTLTQDLSCTPMQAKLMPRASAAGLPSERVLAFAGIGRPEKFYATLRDLSLEIAETRDFPDHHPYTDSEIGALLERADALNAIPITTEKDAVRLSPHTRTRVATLPIEVTWQDPAQIDRLITTAAEGCAPRG